MLYSSQELSVCLLAASHTEKDVEWDLRYAGFVAVAQVLELIVNEIFEWQAEDSLELAF